MRKLILAALATSIASPAMAVQLLYEGFNYTTDSRLIGQLSPDTGSFWVEPSMPNQPGAATDLHRIQAGSLQFNGLSTSTGGSLSVPRTPNSNISRLRLPLPTGADPTTGSWNVNTIPGDDATGDSMYFSFLMQLTDFTPGAKPPGDALNDIEFIAGFHWGYSDIQPFSPNLNVGPTMTTGGAYGAMVVIRESPTTPGAAELGIVKNNASIVGEPASFTIAWTDQAFMPGADPLLIVGEYHFKGNPTSATAGADISRHDDTARLWINPTPGEAAPASAAESSLGPDLYATQAAAVGPFASGSQIRSFYFRSDDDGPGSVLFDELRIGTNWADVVPVPLAGDFNGNAYVNGADFLTWQRGHSPMPMSVEDFDAWKMNFGTTPAAASAAHSTPEPSGLGLMAMAAAALFARRRTSF